jgi:hypothetical protein
MSTVAKSELEFECESVSVSEGNSPSEADVAAASLLSRTFRGALETVGKGYKSLVEDDPLLARLLIRGLKRYFLDWFDFWELYGQYDVKDIKARSGFDEPDQVVR